MSQVLTQTIKLRFQKSFIFEEQARSAQWGILLQSRIAESL